MADAAGLNPAAARRGGSSPSSGTILLPSAPQRGGNDPDYFSGTGFIAVSSGGSSPAWATRGSE
jgi:hypothetical protein